MTELTAESIRDFQLCRHLYKRKHIDGVSERKSKAARDRLVDDYEDALTKTVKWYYFETMSDKVPSFKNLLWKWEKLWFKGVTPEQIMTEQTDPGKNRNTFNTEARKILTHFYNTHKSPGEVINVNENYVIPLTPSTKVTGTIDLVIRQNNKVIIKHLAPRTRASYNRGTLGGTKVILDSIAFRHLSGGYENKVNIELLREGKNFDISVVDSDINEVKAVADEIAHSRNFYPNRGCYWCKSCQFQTECNTWSQ